MKIKPIPAVAAAVAAYYAPAITSRVGPKIASIVRPSAVAFGTPEEMFNTWVADNTWFAPASRLALGLGAYFLVGAIV